MVLRCIQPELRAAETGGEVFKLRRDIWLGIAGRSVDGVSFALQCNEPTLTFLLHLPPAQGAALEPPQGYLRRSGPGRHILGVPEGPHLVLCVASARLKAILGEDVATLPAHVRAVLEQTDPAEGPVGEALRTTLSPEQLWAGRALLHCPYEGAVRNMLFKSKALELIALFFGQLAVQEAQRRALLPREHAAIAKAGALLLRDLENPPGLQELARSVGINDTKLKRGFKAVYGTAPYAYLRAQRMVAARELLVVQGLSVSETAARVGYGNVSHFIDAFARHHGLRPGTLLRSRCA